MTTPAVPPVDQGNQLLAEVPAQLSTSLVDVPGGQRMALTIRTASTTLTVLLNGADAKSWAANIAGTASQMSTSGLIAAASAPAVT